MDLWLSRIKEILVNPDVNALELLDIIHNDLTSTEIYVFTPKGEQRSIEKGATVLDFAYLIHTEIGNKAIAAKVNQRLVSLSHVVKTGDQVEIITAEEEHPKREWLQFLKTRKARSLVMDYFKNERKQTIEFGKSVLEDQVQALGYKPSEDLLQRIEAAYDAPDREELYYRVGMGQIKLDKLSDILKSKQKVSLLRKIFHREENTPKKQEEVYVIGGKDDDGHQFVIATCCNPIPGDPVVGFKSPDGKIIVHKKSCAVAEEIAATHGDWVVVPKWLEEQGSKSFLVRISLKGLDRVGLLNEISRFLSLVMGANMRRLNLSADEGIFSGYIDLYVNSKDVLEQILRKLSHIDGIESVSRSEL